MFQAGFLVSEWVRRSTLFSVATPEFLVLL